MDPRARTLASIVAEWSLELSSADTLLVQYEDAFQDAAELLAEEAEKCGAKVRYLPMNIAEQVALIQRSDDEELIAYSNSRLQCLDGVTARARIDANTNPAYLEGVDSEKGEKFQRLVSNPFLDHVVGDGLSLPGIKWCIVAHPTAADAKAAGMSEAAYADFVYGATNIDWSTIKAQMEYMKHLFDDAKEIHVEVPGMTDLRLSLEGRAAGISDGKFNMPDGEFFYAPIETSIEGVVTFPYPSNYAGNEVAGVQLQFYQGEIVRFDATKNRAYLERLFDNPDNRRLGEFGIGCNTGIQRYTNNILFDEKMGGTVHMAIGESYPHSLRSGGGMNNKKYGKNPTIHWDFVCDLRPVNQPGGTLSVNGIVVQKNGIWQF